MKDIVFSEEIILSAVDRHSEDGRLDMTTGVLYTYDTHGEKRRAVLSTLSQSMAWLSFPMIADRLRYTNLTALDIEHALNSLTQHGKAERTYTWSEQGWIWRVKL